MSKLQTYRITLTPLEAFFFGGEHTFGAGDNSNYYAVSNLYPQQTALLGLIRQEILFQNNKDFKLIGDESFNADGTITEYGVINKVSPLMLMKRDKPKGKPEYFVFDSREYCPDEKGEKETPILFNADTTLATAFDDGIAKDFVPKLDNYSVKRELSRLLVSLNGGKQMRLMFDKQQEKDESAGIRKYNILNGPFETMFQVGIKKQSEEESFFKKESVKLRPGFHFVFFIQLEGDKILLNDNHVMMGGERSSFMMRVEDCLDNKNNIPTNPIENNETFYGAVFEMARQTTNKLVLLSDAFVTNDIFKYCKLAIADIVEFRNIRSKSNHTRYYASLQNKDANNLTTPFKSSKLHLMQRGSVLYYDAKDEKDLVACLHNENYHLVGFNHFKLIPAQNQ